MMCGLGNVSQPSALAQVLPHGVTGKCPPNHRGPLLVFKSVKLSAHSIQSTSSKSIPNQSHMLIGYHQTGPSHPM